MFDKSVSHADAAELAQEFKEGLQELFPDMNIPVLHTNPVIATHTGKKRFCDHVLRRLI